MTSKSGKSGSLLAKPAPCFPISPSFLETEKELKLAIERETRVTLVDETPCNEDEEEIGIETRRVICNCLVALS